MTAVATLTGASSTMLNDWTAINWQKAEQQVKRLQMRIAKAIREGREGKAKALQWLLTHSCYAKLLAVRRVTQNQGRETAGVDKMGRDVPLKLLPLKSIAIRRHIKIKAAATPYDPTYREYFKQRKQRRMMRNGKPGQAKLGL